MGKESAYLYQTGVAKATEEYLTFWFNLNNVSIPDPFTYWPPEKPVVPGQHRQLGERLVAADGVAVRAQAERAGLQGFLSWPKASGNYYDYQGGQFDLANGWQKITLGYRTDAWVAVWVNDRLVRYDTDVSHDDPYG